MSKDWAGKERCLLLRAIKEEMKVELKNKNDPEKQMKKQVNSAVDCLLDYYRCNK
ncbi:MAG: hypothetical protein F6K58_10450 [Symploca sp. SIO2E9]|nr:hypothetical protein [Symploca sp. SIO2E9]